MFSRIQSDPGIHHSPCIEDPDTKPYALLRPHSLGEPLSNPEESDFGTAHYLHEMIQNHIDAKAITDHSST